MCYTAEMDRTNLEQKLQRLSSDPTCLRERGLTTDTLSHFGLSRCKQGSHHGKILIPLHDAHGQLVAVASRDRDNLLSTARLQYLLSDEDEIAGTSASVRGSVQIYNICRITRPVRNLIIVAGFASVWWLHQFGFRNTIAIIPSAFPKSKAQLIASHVMPEGRAWVISSSDSSGAARALQIVEQISLHRFVRWKKLKRGQKLIDFNAAELSRLFV